MPHPLSTRREILDTALQLFTVQGYDATSLRQIADRLGFTKAALYYHFPAKDHLVIELTRPWLDAISNLISLDEQHARDDVAARRARLLSDYVDIVLAHQAVLRFLGQDLGAMKHPDVGKRARNLVLALQDALAGPDADDEDRVRVACALGAVHSASSLDAAVLATARPVLVSVASQALGLQV
jgi:AcrR family transcriptional regulator